MDNLFVIMLCALIVAAIVYAVVRLLPSQRQSMEGEAPNIVQGGASPYKLVSSLLTNTERDFYNYLVQAVAGELHIFSKVRLADLVETNVDIEGWLGYFRKISQKHVDFVLCSLESMKPRLVIELDDSSHDRPEAQRRDQVKNAALDAAGLPILRVPVQPVYSVETLSHAIRRQMALDTTALNMAMLAATHSPVKNGFKSVLKRMRSEAEERAKARAANTPKKGEKAKGKGIWSQLALPAVVILVAVMAFAQIKANSTNANAMETAVDPLLTPQIADAKDQVGGLVLTPGSGMANTPAPGLGFGGDATVNAKSLNMRKGPGTQFEPLGAFGAGTRLSLLGKDGGSQWVNVKSADGVVGWMAVKYVTLSVPIENVPVMVGY